MADTPSQIVAPTAQVLDGSLAANGIAIAIKIAATSWVIYGTGLT